MPLSDVQHQPAAQQFVQRAMRCDRLPHGMIFAGPSGVGRQLFASRLAQLLLCSSQLESDDDQTIDACGACDHCIMMAAGTHPDYHVVHRLLNKYHSDSTVRNRKATRLGIDVVRQFLIDPIGKRPSHAAAKVFVVAEAELANPEAQNALLKTLEEPPNNSHVILIATSADAMLETVRSRCQTVRFDALPIDFVRERLTATHTKLTDAHATFLAELSGGSIGEAMWMASVGMHERIDDAVMLIESALKDPVAAGVSAGALAKTISEQIKSDDDDRGDTNLNRLGQTSVIALLSALLRDAMRTAGGHHPNASVSRRLDALATTARPGALAVAIRALNQAEFYVGRSVNSGLTFDSIGIAIRRGLTANA